MITRYEVDVDIEHPHSRDDLAFLIADRMACNAVDLHNAGLGTDGSTDEEEIILVDKYQA